MYDKRFERVFPVIMDHLDRSSFDIGYAERGIELSLSRISTETARKSLILSHRRRSMERSVFINKLECPGDAYRDLRAARKTSLLINAFMKKHSDG